MMLEQMRRAAPDLMKGFPDGALTMFVNPADRSPLKAGDILFSEPLDREADKKVNFRFPIALNEPQILPIQPLAETLKDMTDVVGGLVPKFAPFV